ncbi:MAG: hypothetical protein WDW36_001613 [Sanguina aurantia]
MVRCKTRFSAFAVKFSPFKDGRLAVATGQNFGVVGNGRLHVFEVAPNGMVQEVAGFDTNDGLFDCAWSEENENVLVTACGDGSIKIYDLALPLQANPVRALREHTKECCCVSWNPTKRDLFLSSGWDDSVKLWSMGQPNQSLRTFRGHTYCVYQVAWNPQAADVFLSASGDSLVKVWDLRQPGPTLTIKAHGTEVLTADWNKYNDCVLATGSVDQSIKLWDVRNPTREVSTLVGHRGVVRKVLFSPHSESVLASSSYDMTVKLWDVAALSRNANPLLCSWEHHTEFVQGLDFSMLREGLIASASWDEFVYLWTQDQQMARP